MKRVFSPWVELGLGVMLVLFGESAARNAVADGQSAAYLVATGIEVVGLLFVMFALGTWVVMGIKRLLRRG